MNNNSIIHGFCPNFSSAACSTQTKFSFNWVLEKEIDLEWSNNLFDGPDNVPSFVYRRFGSCFYSVHISSCEQVYESSQVNSDMNIDDESIDDGKDDMSIGDYDDEDAEDMDLFDCVSYDDDDERMNCASKYP